MINLYVKLNANGFVEKYEYTDYRKSLEWHKTNHDGDYVADISIYAKKLVDGLLVLDEEEFARQEEERNKPIPPQPPTQLDRIESQVIATDENTLTLMEGIATAYEAQENNAMDIMEGIATIYEEQLNGGVI